MGPIWGQQDPGGPHVGPMNFAIWVVSQPWQSYIYNDGLKTWEDSLFIERGPKIFSLPQPGGSFQPAASDLFQGTIQDVRSPSMVQVMACWTLRNTNQTTNILTEENASQNATKHSPACMGKDMIRSIQFN